MTPPGNAPEPPSLRPQVSKVNTRHVVPAPHHRARTNAAVAAAEELVELEADDEAGEKTAADTVEENQAKLLKAPNARAAVSRLKPDTRRPNLDPGQGKDGA